MQQAKYLGCFKQILTQRGAYQTTAFIVYDLLVRHFYFLQLTFGYLLMTDFALRFTFCIDLYRSSLVFLIKCLQTVNQTGLLRTQLWTSKLMAQRLNINFSSLCSIYSDLPILIICLLTAYIGYHHRNNLRQHLATSTISSFPDNEHKYFVDHLEQLALENIFCLVLLFVVARK